MGVYGRYGKIVCVISCIQMALGVLMVCLGIALRVFVCSWVTDASFGFWVGLLVLIGGSFGYCSATKDNYSYITLYLSSNSFSIMFATLAIFCHSIAFVHFNYQMRPSANVTNATNSTNNNSSLTTSTVSVSHIINKRRRRRDADETASSSFVTKITPTSTGNMMTNATGSLDVSSSPSPTHSTGGYVGPRCYTDQTWSDYDNGMRGMCLGASMIFLCLFEIVMCITSSACCWAATKVRPIGIRRKRATIQGTVSEMLREQNSEVAMRRRHGESVLSSSVVANENVVSTSTDENQEGNNNTLPSDSTSAQISEEPVTNWYSTSRV